MEIKCKKTKRFLCSINYDEIIELLYKYGVVLERPLEIVIPCRACKESEVYHIYKDHYVFKENRKANPKNTEIWQINKSMSYLYHRSAVDRAKAPMEVQEIENLYFF